MFYSSLISSPHGEAAEKRKLHPIIMSILVYLCVLSVAITTSCPMDLNYVTIPWDFSYCHSNIPKNSSCCQSLLSLYFVALSQHLKDTSLFFLPDLPTSICCLTHFRNKLSSLSLSLPSKQSREGSHPTKRVAGTHDYLAPEYALYGQLSEKSDAYSFEVVVLEMMCGRKALDLSSSQSECTFFIWDWAWSLVKAGKWEELFDASLLESMGFTNTNPREVMERFVLVGIFCAHVMVASRPTILDALKMLEGDIEVPVIPDLSTCADGNSLSILLESSMLDLIN